MGIKDFPKNRYHYHSEGVINTEHPFYSYGLCHHWRQPVRVGRFQVTCSARFSGEVTRDFAPDFGIYLDKGWNEKLGQIWTNGAALKRAALRRPYPALVIDWLDMNTISVDLVNDLVEICLSKMRQGKRIDIACNHGHGRTGTLLACLIARVEHLPPELAIKQVHERYCQHAVETHAQHELVKAYVKTIARRMKRMPKPDRLPGECPKGGDHEWGTDGMHSNVYCKKCFTNK